MRKAMKRFFTMLLLMAVMITLVPKTVLAEQEERSAVLVQIPSDWENPCIWAWDEAGNNAFESWPGGEMEADAANEGWYYAWIPSWANHVIINANEGSVQTEELILEGKDVWITISAPDAAEISYEKQTEGDIPEYVEKFEIHAKVDAGWESPCLWAWSAPDGTNAFESWPGMAMKEGEDGWYTAKAPVWVNSIIINANEGSVQTEDIAIDAAEIWVTVDAEGAYDFSYKNPDQAEIPNVTIKVLAPADWESPCLWAWSAPDGTNVFTTWPGEALEEGEDGWLTKEIPGWVNSVIVNGNEGSVQTTDISVETGKNIWLVVNGPEDFTVSYEEPDAATVSAGATEKTEADTATADTATAEAEADTATVSTTETETAEVISEAVSSDSNAMVIMIVIAAVVVVVVIAGVVISKKKGTK